MRKRKRMKKMKRKKRKIARRRKMTTTMGMRSVVNIDNDKVQRRENDGTDGCDVIL